jgi:archaellum component FlaC
MTTAADDTREVGRFKASNQRLRDEIEYLADEIEDLADEIEDLADEIEDLADEIEDLRSQLAEVRCLTPYDLPADVLAVLKILLPGWPAARWRELARRIEEHPAS